MPDFRPENFEALEPHIRRRVRLGIAQCDVAARMRLHPSTVCKYELGRVLRVPDAWASAYAEAVADLAERKRRMRSELVTALSRLTPEQRQALAEAGPAALLYGDAGAAGA